MVLASVLKNLGIDPTLAEAQKLLGNTNLATIEVDDLISNKLTAEYFTKEAALQNPEIRSKIKAETLNGIDAHTKELMTEYGIDAETMAEIFREEKSSKKLSKMVDKIAQLTKEKSKATGADKEVLNLEIEKLNKQIAETKTTYESKLLEEQKARKTDRINWELDNIYNTLDYSLSSDKEVSVTAAKAVIGNIAAKKGLRFETTETGVQILTKEGTEYYADNIKVSPQDFIKKSLMENKLLKVSDTVTPGQSGTTTPGQPARPTYGNRQVQGTSFNAALDSAINGLPQMPTQ